MAFIKALKAANGTYTDSSGEEKTNWVTIGYLNDTNGKKSLKINSFPVGGDWDGWVQIFDLDKDRKDEF